jgi:hypothetical protein
MFKTMYNFTKFAMELNEPEPNVAPTDSRLRPDQRLLEEGDMIASNEVKFKLEEKQRAKRKLQENEPEPVWFDKIIESDTQRINYAYNNKYWSCKKSQNWNECPDLFN